MSLDRSIRSTSSFSGDVLVTPETSVSTGNVDMATQLKGQECISFLSGLQGIFQPSRDLELKLSASIKRIVEKSLQAFKESVQNEIQSLNKIILTLTARVTHLDEKLQSNSSAVRVDVVNLNQSSAEGSGVGSK